MKVKKNTKRRRAKLTKEDVENLRRTYEKTTMSYEELAIIYRISYSQVGRIVRRERWVNV